MHMLFFLLQPIVAQVVIYGMHKKGIYSHLTVRQYMTKLYGYDRNDDGIMLNKRIY